MTPLLLTTFADPERVKFARYKVKSDGGLQRRGISLRVLKRVFRALIGTRDHPEFSSLIVMLTVIGGETVLRPLVKRVLSPGVRGIPISPKKPRELLVEVINPKVKGKEKVQMLKLLEATIGQALEEFKERTGTLQPSSPAFCYAITDDVIAAAKSEACREYLEMNARSCPHILSGELPHFLEILAGRFPDEVQSVSQKLQGSRTREHLAAISLTGEGVSLNVTLVNTDGCRVTMKARRFVQMMANPGQAIQLGEFPDPRRYREPEIIFNNAREGVVHGLFSVNHGCIEVICVDPNKSGVNALLDRSQIAIDVDYALCVALILDRLHRDEERVSRLMQELSTKAVDDGHRQLFTLS